jgi:cytochrome c biogenesis protein CcmG/thiol:disulfide interchange protein DsbE
MINRILIILLIIASSVGYSLYQSKNLESQLSVVPEAILSKLPQGVFETLDGATFDPSKLYDSDQKTNLLVVHFWGTWCAPCEAELPDLMSFIKKYEGRSDVKFLLVAVNDEKQKILKHLKKLSIPTSSIHWLIDNRNIHRDTYGTTRVPETYVFSSDKATLRKYMGPQEWGKSMFSQVFEDFIQLSEKKL